MLETPQSQLVETQIAAVTVYEDRALVTRRGTIAISAQTQELVVADLPLTLQTDSVRVSGSGAIAVQLLGVRVDHKFTAEPVEERLAQLTLQMEALRSQKGAVQDRMDALVMQRNFVQGLSDKSVDRFANSLARGQTDLAQARGLLTFLGEQYIDYANAIATTQTESQEIDKQIQVLQQQMRLLQTPRPNESYNLVVAIAASSEGAFNLEVTYIVNNANWTPLYDVRVSQNKDRSSVTLDYLAEVQQSTGEDWVGIKLTLSTAKPGLGTLPPKLEPWYIDTADYSYRKISTPMMVAPAPVMARSTELAASYDRADEEPIYQAEAAIAEVKQEGGVVTFTVERLCDIPSDGTPHKNTILNAEYPCRITHIAIPKLVSFAYLQAIVTNPTDGATLLAGSVNIFREGMYVGVAEIENIAPGQEFKLNLGIDEGLKIERDLVERKVDKRFISDRRRTTYAYRVKLENLSDRPINLQLTEQLPKSRHEKIEVRLSTCSPQIQPGEMGLMEWSLVLAPKAKQEIDYQFAVEHPVNLPIAGINI
jgi:uncharacterized protein (TIGR02231 family)